jgi:NADPH-dependent 2,4-dienoyl-CoA reductase/sulfur reductase-like enzyme
MERQLDEVSGRLLQQSLQARGMKFLIGAQTQELVAGESGRVSAIRFKDGSELPADLVVMAVGIRPNTALAESMRLHVNKGIVVSDTLQTVTDPRIYAVGECAAHRGIAYGLVAPLFEQGKVLATHLAEFGIVAPQGMSRVADLLAVLLGEDEATLPPLARQALRSLAAELEALGKRVEEIELAIIAWHKENETSRRLAAVPGIGPITASAIVATVGDVSNFASARHFAAWIGLVPKQNSTGGKPRQGGISKAGDRYLRRLLVLGASAVIRHIRIKAREGWLADLIGRRPTMVAAVAANIAWKMKSVHQV